MLVFPLLVFPGFGSVGALLAFLRPRLTIAWLMLAMALLSGVVPTAELANGIVIVGCGLLLILFPTGRPVSPRWWGTAALLVVGWLIAVFAPGLLVNTAPDFSLPVGVVAAAVGLGGAVAAPFVRYRRSLGVERAQLRWLGYVGVVMTATAIPAALLVVLRGDAGVAELLGGLGLMMAFVGSPVAIAVAVFRYRLFDIDVLIRRTLTFAVVGTVLAMVYGFVVIGLSTLLPATASDLAVASSTLATFTIFRPLRVRVRRWVEHRFHRAPYDLAATVEGLAARLRNETDLAVVGGDLVGVTKQALQPSRVDLWIRRL